jgi:hypothetical protein
MEIGSTIKEERNEGLAKYSSCMIAYRKRLHAP